MRLDFSSGGNDYNRDYSKGVGRIDEAHEPNGRGCARLRGERPQKGQRYDPSLRLTRAVTSERVVNRKCRAASRMNALSGPRSDEHTRAYPSLSCGYRVFRSMSSHGCMRKTATEGVD